MGFVLSIISLFLFILVFILDTIFKLFYHVAKRQWYMLINKRFFYKAYLIDVFGNFIFADFWNYTLSKGGYKFGVFGETLSSCFGKKLQEKSLSILGYIIACSINIVDFSTWHKGGHCFDSILTKEQIDKFKDTL